MPEVRPQSIDAGPGSAWGGVGKFEEYTGLIITTGERAHGRARAVHQITQALDDAGAGSGSAVLLTGTRRCGRTQFLDDVVRMHAGAAVVLEGLRDSSASPSAALRPLFTRLGIDAHSGRPDGRGEVPGSIDDTAVLLGDLVLGALESYTASEHPLLIAVDDADLLPDLCIAVLGYIARRLAKLRAFLLLVSGPHIHTRFDALLRMPMYTLTLSEARALVESVSGYRTSGSALVNFQSISRGNPADLRELCDVLSAEQLRGLASVTVFPSVHPERIHRWRDVFERVTATQRLALSVLAIAHTATPEALVTCLHAEAETDSDVAAEVAALMAAGHVERIRDAVGVPNQLDCAAIYAISPPQLRHHGHRLVDTHALLRERPWHAAVNHVLADGVAGEHVGELLTATERLTNAGEVGLALGALRWALGNVSDGPATSALAAQGLRIATVHGYLTDAEYFGEHLDVAVLAPADAAAAMSILVQLHYFRDDPFDAEDIGRTVAMLAGRCPDAAATLAGAAAYFHTRRYEKGFARGLVAVADRSVATEGNLFAALARTQLAIADDAPDRASRSLSAIESTPSRAHAMEALISAQLLQQLGRHQEAGHRLRHLSRRVLAPLERVVLLYLQVDHEMFTGNIAGAQTVWDEADDIVPADNCLAATRLTQRVHLLGLTGHFDAAEELAEGIRSRSILGTNRVSEARFFWALGQIALMRGDDAAAVLALQQSLDLADCVAGYWFLQRHVDFIEALSRLGHMPAAEAALHDLEARLPTRHSPGASRALARARLLVATSDERARTALSQALGPRTNPAPTMERARAHAAYATRGFTEVAAEERESHRKSAQALFSRIGASGWTVAGARPGRAARQRAQTADSPSVLYDTALRVIAEEFIDPDLNVRSLARRLGVSVRTLHRAFEQHGPGSVLHEIRGRRIERAENLLQHPDHAQTPLESIAQMSGAPSVAYLRLGIKEKHGMSPSQLRRTCAGRANPGG